jgi:hypothetical protein
VTDFPRYGPLDIEEQIENIRRARAESDKFIAEQRKLMDESNKLAVEANKLNRDFRLAAWIAAGGVILAVAALLTAVANLIHMFR